MDAVERHAPWRDDSGGASAPQSASRSGERHVPKAGDSAWSPWMEATFSHIHHSSRDEVVDRMRSVSHIAVLPGGRQRVVLDEIRTILRDNPQTRDKATVGIPYRVDAMYTERLG
jgi:hypothetical protein